MSRPPLNRKPTRALGAVKAPKKWSTGSSSSAKAASSASSSYPTAARARNVESLRGKDWVWLFDDDDIPAATMSPWSESGSLSNWTFVSRREFSPFSEGAQGIMVAHRNAESIADFCQATGQFWQGSSRFITAIAALRCDDSEVPFCLTMARAQQRISAEEATPSFIHACELGAVRACDEGSQLVLAAESPDLDIADMLMQRRCVNDSAPHCRSRIQLVHPADLSRYESDCNESIGLACLKKGCGRSGRSKGCFLARASAGFTIEIAQ